MISTASCLILLAAHVVGVFYICGEILDEELAEKRRPLWLILPRLIVLCVPLVVPIIFVGVSSLILLSPSTKHHRMILIKTGSALFAKYVLCLVAGAGVCLIYGATR